MNFINLLGKKLKDDVIIEILENHDIDVIYYFDRTHENMEDIYWAELKEQGYIFRFDQKQILDTIFLYIEEQDDYKKIDRNSVTLPIYDSFDEAESIFKKNNIPYVSSIGVPGAKRYKWWIKAEYKNHTIHYEFKDNRIRVITLSIT